MTYIIGLATVGSHSLGKPLSPGTPRPLGVRPPAALPRGQHLLALHVCLGNDGRQSFVGFHPINVRWLDPQILHGCNEERLEYLF